MRQGFAIIRNSRTPMGDGVLLDNADLDSNNVSGAYSSRGIALRSIRIYSFRYTQVISGMGSRRDVLGS